MRPCTSPSVAYLLTIWLATLSPSLLASPARMTGNQVSAPVQPRSISERDPQSDVSSPRLGPGIGGNPDWADEGQPTLQIPGPESSASEQLGPPANSSAHGFVCWGQAESAAAADTISDCQQAIAQVVATFNLSESVWDQLPRGASSYWGGPIWKYLNEGATYNTCQVTFVVPGRSAQPGGQPWSEPPQPLPVPAQPYTPTEIEQATAALLDTCLVQEGQLFGDQYFSLAEYVTLRVRVQRSSGPQDPAFQNASAQPATGAAGETPPTELSNGIPVDESSDESLED